MGCLDFHLLALPAADEGLPAAADGLPAEVEGLQHEVEEVPAEVEAWVSALALDLRGDPRAAGFADFVFFFVPVCFEELRPEVDGTGSGTELEA